MRRSLLFPVVVAIFAACVPPMVRLPTPSAPAGPKVTSPNTAGPWTLSAAPLSHQVVISAHAVVTIAGDSSTRTDTVQATLSASYVWASSAHRRVDGLLADFRVGVNVGVPSTPAGLQLPRPFSAEVAPVGGPLGFLLPQPGAACTDPALSAAQYLHDAWFRMPDTLFVGQEWADMVQTLTCRDRVPLRGTTIRKFRVLRGEIEDSAKVAVLVERASTGHLAGEGDQFGEHVVVAGESSGLVRYAVDPLSGRVLRATGNTSLTFSLTSRRRIQHVHQENQLTIRWVP